MIRDPVLYKLKIVPLNGLFLLDPGSRDGAARRAVRDAQGRLT
jgi:hypothetical protein